MSNNTINLVNGWVAIPDGNPLSNPTNVTLRQVQETPGGPLGTFKEVVVPAVVLLSYAATLVRDHKKEQLDDLSPKEILGLR